MYSCDIWDCFSILGIFNQWDYISGNVEIAMTHMNSDSIHPDGSIYFMKMQSLFLEVRNGCKQSFSPLSQGGSSNRAYQEDRAIFWPLSTKRIPCYLPPDTYWLENCSYATFLRLMSQYFFIIAWNREVYKSQGCLSTLPWIRKCIGINFTCPDIFEIPPERIKVR